MIPFSRKNGLNFHSSDDKQLGTCKVFEGYRKNCKAQIKIPLTFQMSKMVFNRITELYSKT